MTTSLSEKSEKTAVAKPLDIVTPLSSRVLFWRPRHLEASPLLSHVPFLFWAVDVLRPSCLVQLGLPDGVGYFALCQAVDKLDLDARCYGLRLPGDAQHADRDAAAGISAGGEDAGSVETEQTSETVEKFADSSAIPDALEDHNTEQYQEFSRLLATPLKGALRALPPGGIDLLLVDMALDQEALEVLEHEWLPRMSDNGLVLIHGAATRFAEPGARAFRDRLGAGHACVTLEAGEGLFAVLCNPRADGRLTRLSELELGMPGYSAVHRVFSRLGAMTEAEWQSRTARARAEALDDALARERDARAALDSRAADLGGQLDTLNTAYDARNTQLGTLQARLLDLTGRQDEMTRELRESGDRAAGLKAELDALRMTQERVQTERDQKAQQAAQLQSRLDDALRSLAEANQHRDAARAEAERLRAEAERNAAARADLEAQLAARPEPSRIDPSELRLLTGKLEEAREAQARLQEALKEAEAGRQRAEALFAESEYLRASLVESTSWKLTAPARKLINLTRRGG